MAIGCISVLVSKTATSDTDAMNRDRVSRRAALGGMVGATAASQMPTELFAAQTTRAASSFFGTARFGSQAAAIAAGEAATTPGDLFTVDDAAGNLIFRERVPQGSVEVARTVTPAALAASEAAQGSGSQEDGTIHEPHSGAARLIRAGAKCDYDFSTDAGSDDSDPLQAVFDDADANRVQSVELPGFNKNFLLGSAPLKVMEPGLLVRGDKGVTYNRGMKKNGNLVVGPGVDAALKIGGAGIGPGDPFKNPADQWEIEHLGFAQAPGAAQKSKIGILFDRQTNGPDRGFILRGVSGQGLRSLFEVAPKRDGVQTALANLVIIQCNGSNNRWAIKVNAPIYGLSAHNNQVEQNNNGTGRDGHNGGFIHGDIQGAVTVADNMIEGQPDAVDLAPSIGSIEGSFTGNYVEKNNVNFGRFVFRLGTAHTFLNNTAYFARNFSSGVDFPPDYLVINRRGNWHLIMEDRQPVTFNKWAGSLLRGSRLFAPGVRHFKLRGIDAETKSPEIYLGDAYSHPDVSGGGVVGVTALLGGTGYSDGETVELRAVDGSGYGAKAIVNAAGGVVTRLRIIDPGALYQPGEHLTIIGRGSTSGSAKANVSAYAWRHTTFSDGVRFASPMGAVRARSAASTTALGFGCNPGDLIVAVVYVLVTDNTARTLKPQLTTGAGALVASLGESEVHNISQGQWAFICYPMVAPSAQSTLGFRYASANGTAETFIAGISARNFGPYRNDGTVARDVYPVIPRL